MKLFSARDLRISIVIGAAIGAVLAALILIFGQPILNWFYHSVPGRMYALNKLSNTIVHEHVYASEEDDPLEIAYLAYYGEEEAPKRAQIRKAFREEIRADPDAYYTIANLMLSHFDRYSNLSAPEIYEQKYPDNEDYTGLGVTVSRYGPFIRVASAYSDSPAGRAGLQEGDLVCTVGDTDIRTMEYADAKTLLYDQAEEGTVLGVLRSGEDSLLYFEIQSGEVHIPNVSWEIRGEIGYLNITLFQGDSFKRDVQAAMDDFSEAGVLYLVLDMRDNRGGLITDLEFLLNALVPEKDVLLFTEHYRRSDDLFYSKGTGASFKDIAVLVDEKTHSAAEVVSGSLKDMGYMLIGETTYGKAVGLSNMDFCGDRLVLATMTLELPETGDYNDVGIHPNIYVENEVVSADPVFLLPLETAQILPDGDSRQILAMEQRLVLLGYLFTGADGVWDADTDEALDALYQALGKPYSGICEEEILTVLEELAEKCINAKYLEDTQLKYAYEYLEEIRSAQAA